MKRWIIITWIAVCNLAAQESGYQFKKTISMAVGTSIPGNPPSIDIWNGLSYGNRSHTSSLLTGYSRTHVKLSENEALLNAIPLIFQEVVMLTDGQARLGVTGHAGILYTFMKNHKTNMGGSVGGGLVFGKSFLIHLKGRNDFISFKDRKNKNVLTLAIGFSVGL